MCVCKKRQKDRGGEWNEGPGFIRDWPGSSKQKQSPIGYRLPVDSSTYTPLHMHTPSCAYTSTPKYPRRAEHILQTGHIHKYWG